MKISFNYSYADFCAIADNLYKVSKSALWSNRAFWGIIALNVVIGLAILAWVVISGVPLKTLYFANIILAGVIIALRYVLGHFNRKYYYKQQMVEGKNFAFEFSHAGFSVVSEFENAEVKWPSIILAHETQSHFLLWINKIQAYSLPKHAFEDKQQCQQFREIIADSVEHQELLNV
jgi:hypothetical protein